MSQKNPSPVNSKVLIALTQRDKVFAAAMQLIVKLYKKEKRPFTGIQYASHPMTVVSLLVEYTFDNLVLTAAVLQDTLTKTSLKETTLRTQFGDDIANIVVALTPPAEGGFAAYQAQLSEASKGVKAIKLASLLDDLCAIPTKNLAASQDFVSQARVLVEVLAADETDELASRVRAAVRRATV